MNTKGKGGSDMNNREWYERYRRMMIKIILDGQTDEEYTRENLEEMEIPDLEKICDSIMER